MTSPLDDLSDPNNSESLQQFDTNIPTLHKYLGPLNSVSGYNIFDDGEILTLVALHTNTIVSPGFTIPFILDEQNEQDIMTKSLAEKSVFAVVFKNERYENLFAYGMIMEVYESFTKQGCMYFKSRGRQRCKILFDREIGYLAGRLLQVTVEVIAEGDSKSPISCTQLAALKRSRPFCYDEYNSRTEYVKYRRYHLAQFPYSSWVYDNHEVDYYCKVIVELLKRHHLKDYIPTNSMSLSYWFLQNFLLLREERLEILKQNSVLERLRLEHKFLLVESRTICCSFCRSTLAQHYDVFNMSKEGIQSTYCNPGGHVYEILTVKNCTNYVTVGNASGEFSWFPGYQWLIMQCSRCISHIGWMFIAKELNPLIFYGLARVSLDIKISATGANNDV